MVLEGLTERHRAVEDLGELTHEEALARTAELVHEGETLIYQAHLEVTTTIAGEGVRLVGYPDFLIPEGERWVIGDAKLVRQIHKPDKDGNSKERPDKKAIFDQLRLYGWLFEQSFPGVPFALRVYNGAGRKEDISYDGGASSFVELERVLAVQAFNKEPDEVVGWSKCGSCEYREHCWPRALERDELGLIVAIDVSLGRKLQDEGFNSYPEIQEGLDERELATIKNPRKGPDDPANRAGARRILENIKAVTSGQVVRRLGDDGEPVPLPDEISSDANYVMFDLEGIPPELDEGEKVYLWGMQVFGSDPGDFVAGLADFGEEGDRQGWEEFLREARSILDAHPGIRFVHWAPYEKTMISRYVKRFGDDSLGTAAEVQGLLLDLLPITKKVAAIPAPSYSLKVVEKLDAVAEVSGFKRTADEVAKGDDSIAAYMEAVETRDMTRRQEIVDAILAYNKEDLEATWAVQQWLMGLAEKD